MAKTIKARRERKLPKQQLAILAICRFAEPIASTSLFPYLPEMIRSFGVSQDQVGKWAGICAATFSICQAIMGIPWGRASDRYGRKPAILFGLLTTMITSLLWGFSRSLGMAIAVRAIAGMGNGNVGLIRTTVAEMVPFKELQPRAFSLMPLVWNIGSVFGPSIGGALANPSNVEPGQHIEHPSLFQRFPYALPNIVAAAFFAVGITIGFLFLEETLESRQGKRDFGLELGRKITGLAKRHVLTVEEYLGLRKQARAETEPLIKSAPDEESLLQEMPQKAPLPRPTWREVLNEQAVLNLIVYTLLAMHTMSYDQLLPVFMSYPPYARSVQRSSEGNPLQFAGGFGLDHFRIGLLSTCYGAFGMVVQFFLFPPIARRLGILYCLKWCAVVFPITYFLTPFTVLLPTQTSQVAVCFAIMLVKCVCAIFAFPCSTILLTNSAASLRVLGTLNGIATSVSAVGRAAGPALGGVMFTVGVQRGYIIAPWWFLAAVSTLAAVPVFLLTEGEGFGGDEEDGNIEDSDDEDTLLPEALEGEAEGVGGKPGPVLQPRRRLTEEEEEEEGYGGVGPLLSRTNTISSAVFTEDGDGTPPRQASPAAGRRLSANQASGSRVTRRMSIPIGMNGQPLTRRYSTSLGQSLGSAGSFHG